MMIPALKWWLSGSLLLFLLQAIADQPPQRIEPFHARYQLSRGSLPMGHVEVDFQLDPRGRYRYSAKTRPNKIIALLHDYSVTEMSQGMLDVTRLTPQRYDYHKDKSGQETTLQLNFDWQQRSVTTTAEGSPWSMPVPLGTQDKLSQQLAIRIALLGGANSVSFDVADGGRLKRYHYKKEVEERLHTPFGELTTVRVKRSKQNSPDYTIWFAPSLNYLPVRFEREQSDGLFRMELLGVR